MAQTYTTNVSLPKPTNVNVIHDDMDLLKWAYTAAMNTLENYLSGNTIVIANATGAKVIDTGGKPIIRLQITSLAGSLSSITGAVPYSPFRLICISGVSCKNFGLSDLAPFKLTADWYPNDIGNNITLLWDGTSFIELGRSAAT